MSYHSPLANTDTSFHAQRVHRRSAMAKDILERLTDEPMGLSREALAAKYQRVPSSLTYALLFDMASEGLLGWRKDGGTIYYYVRRPG